MPPLPKVIVTSDTAEKLSKLENGMKGSLCGHFHDGTLVVVGLIVPQTEDDSLDLFNLIPSEIQVCGTFTIGEKVEETQAYFLELDPNGQTGGASLLLTCMKNDLQSHIILNGTVSKVPFSTVSNAQLATTFVYFCTKSEFVISGECTQQGIKQSLEDLKKKVLAEDVAFFLPTRNLLIAGMKSEGISGMPGITADHRVKDLFDSQPERGNKTFEVLPVQMHLKQTKERDKLNVPNTAPLIRHVRRSFENFRIVVKIDALAMGHRNGKVTTLFNILANSFLRGLARVEASLLKQVQTVNQRAMSSPETYHFLPAQSSLFISVVYPKDCNDADLKKQREQLHKGLGFGLDRPLFRRSQAYIFPGEGLVNGPLLNPHQGLNSGVKGGEASLVKGIYSYHHYMQDRFDDNGWGCAYRSLQTIVSWFRLQGYTEVSVPTHKQIQECLVKIGDKPASFVGSRQWIGSTEVSFVLETLLGVTCKILTASTGEEVGSLGSELSYHFHTHGTPIMIGGGVLAHTIIGVDYNRSTGDIKFLILDPHYTGGEDIGIITGKGWVGWKDIKFWTKNAFYNLCLPLRPIGDV